MLIMKPSNVIVGPPRKSCLPAAVVAKMASMGQRKAISMAGMKK